MEIRFCVLSCLQFIFVTQATGNDKQWSETKCTRAVPCHQLWSQIVQNVEVTAEECLEPNSSHSTPGPLSDSLSDSTCEMYRASRFYRVLGQVFPNGLQPATMGNDTSVPLDLQGVELQLITNPWPPYIICERDHLGNCSTVSGFSIDLIKELSKLLNFTYTLDPQGGKWGVALPGGNWTGMVGKLQRKEKDMIIGSLGFQPERAAVMDFSVPFDRVQVTMWILNPRLRRRVWLALFDMLDLNVILLLLVAMFILAILLVVISRVLQNHYETQDFNTGVLNKVFLLLGATLGQGSRSLPMTCTGKVIIAAWWMFSVVFSITYSAMLIASLSANSTQLPFRTAQGMYQQTEYKFGVFGSGTEQMFLESISNDVHHQNVWRKIKEAAVGDPSLISTDYRVHSHRVVQEKYVFIGTQLPVPRHQFHPTIIKFGEVFFEKGVCIGLQRNSTYTASISAGLLKLMKYGIVQKLKKEWWNSRHGPTKSAEVSEVDAIALNTLSGVFFTLGVGLSIAALTLLLEMAVSQFQHRHNRRLLGK